MKNFTIYPAISSRERDSKLNQNLEIMIVHSDWDTVHNIYFDIDIIRPYNLTIKNRGDIAWEHIRKHAPNFLITDIFLYGMGGIKLCEKIREHPEFQEIFVLGLINKSEKKLIKILYNAGFDLILTKPLKGNMINSIIDYHCSQSHLNDMVFDSSLSTSL